MAETIPSINKWRKIFLDTSVIIDLVRSSSSLQPGDYRDRVEFTQNLFAKIKAIRDEEKKPAHYYVSALTIGELLKLDTRNVRQTIATTLSSDNLDIIDYSNEIASDLNKNLKKFIPPKNYKAFESWLKKRLDIEKISNGREWIKDDLKICFCARSVQNLDVVLTADKTTFIPIGIKMNLPILSTYPIHFNREMYGDIAVDIPFTPLKLSD